MTEYREQGLADQLRVDAGQGAANGAATPANPQAPQVQFPGESDGGNPADWHAEAGRKGARRIHQLIQQGKQYEQEHGLKRGRQRLRQLIEEGKLYEQEQRLKAGGEVPGRCTPRLSNEQALVRLFEALLRLVKPAVRRKLARVLQSLENETA
jgi:hypothetical protein